MFGHHVMHLLDPNLDAKVLKLRQNRDFSNPWLEQYEYQADYLAGVCLARRGKKAFNEADLRAAADLVDKAARKMAAKATDAVAVPDPLTHGTPELRLKWMIKGFESGQIRNHGPLYVKDFKNP